MSASNRNEVSTLVGVSCGNDYLQECQEKGLTPEKPASGKLLLRLAPELHGQAMVAAKAAGKSLNQWVAEALDRAVHAD